MKRKFDHQILLLQGGGALGAYQAGVYEGLVEVGVAPTWIVGISIGAINAAIIAGNPPERRVERLRKFWHRVSSYSPIRSNGLTDMWRAAMNQFSAASVMTFGVPGFFSPRVPPAVCAINGFPGPQSVYDTSPLKRTLEELVDFDLLNNGEVRLSLGAVNVETAESRYFDSDQTRIKADHVRASGALPPGFPPIEIDGAFYWDGGMVSNSPLQYVWSERPLRTALILEVDVFDARGKMPRNIYEVEERAKDIQYSSKRRLSMEHTRLLGEWRAALGRLIEKLPAELREDPDVQLLAPLCDDRDWTIGLLMKQRPPHSAGSKDYEFSRATVDEFWAAGLADVRNAAAQLDFIEPKQVQPGVRLLDFTGSYSPSKVEVPS